MTCRVFGSPEADTEVRFGLWDVVEVSTCGRKVGEGGRRWEEDCAAADARRGYRPRKASADIAESPHEALKRQGLSISSPCPDRPLSVRLPQKDGP